MGFVRIHRGERKVALKESIVLMVTPDNAAAIIEFQSVCRSSSNQLRKTPSIVQDEEAHYWLRGGWA